MTKQDALAGAEEASRAFLANCSLRHRRLESLERWVDGRQYDGMQSWWDDANDVPLWERAPCIVYPVAGIASNSNVDLCLGEGKFPEFSVAPDGDETEAAISATEAEELDRFIRKYHERSSFKAHSCEIFLAAQGCGSAAAIHGVRNGKPFQDLVPAKWCEPEFNTEGAVSKLTIQYPFTEEYRQQDGSYAVRAKLYRRVIDDKRDVEFKYADANTSGVEPNWVENPDRTREHGFGFCPVIWYPLMKGATTVMQVDGKAIHANITDEIHAHDIARSQWHRGALLSEPQIIEIGVAAGYNPTDTGRTAQIPMTEKGGEITATNGVIGHMQMGGAPKKARKKGPGWVWQFPDPNSDVKLLIYPAEALKAQQDNCGDLRIKIQEGLAVVFLDPENIKFAATTSGKALEAIKAKQLDRCDKYRGDLAEGFFEPSVSMQLRVAYVVLSGGKGLNVPGASKVLPILTKLAKDDGWSVPTLSCKYGPYFRPDPADQQKIVELVQKALGAGGGIPLITLEIAVQRVASLFDVDPSVLLAALEDAMAKAKKDAEKISAGKPPDDEETKEPETEDEKAA